MDKENIKQQIESITGLKVMLDVSMSEYTSMKIGGKAPILIRVKTEDELKEILKIAKENNISIFILGNGTNVIVRDGGIDSLIIKIEINDIIIKEEDDNGDIFIQTGAGTQLKALVYKLAKLGFGPVAELYGIPATIGGAIKMNAGAYGIEMKDLVHETTYMDYDGNIHTLTLEEHNFGYRDSFFHHNDAIILKSILKLKRVNGEEELKKALEIMESRTIKQPLEYPNTGSIFKRGKDFYASKEIDDAGLKGKQIGGLAVSEKHAGFIINKGNGNTKDFEELVEYVRNTVYEKSGNKLELEVIVIGEK